MRRQPAKHVTFSWAFNRFELVLCSFRSTQNPSDQAESFKGLGFVNKDKFCLEYDEFVKEDLLQYFVQGFSDGYWHATLVGELGRDVAAIVLAHPEQSRICLL